MLPGVAGTTVQELVDRTVDGGLETWLRTKRAGGLSLGSIARVLDREYEIEVTPETVRNWCLDYGIPTHRPGSEPVEAAS